MAHYHEERKHEGLNNTLNRAEPRAAAIDAFVHRRQRLGGMLNYYYRAAA
jgi:putative transposase